MPKENDISAVDTSPSQAVAPVQETAEVKTQESDKGLSTRDALEVAIEATKQDKKDESATKAATDAKGDRSPSEGDSRGTREQARKRTTYERNSDGKFVSTGDARRGNQPSAEPNKDESNNKLEPPAEFTPAEREDFAQLSRVGQEAQLRLHKARQHKIEEIRREAAELQWVKETAKELEPFLKASGGKRSPKEEILLALKAVNELRGEPRQAAITFLKAKGIDPKTLLEAETQAKAEESQQNKLLREELNEVKSYLVQQQKAAQVMTLGEAFKAFAQEKNAAGKPKFPDVNESEAGTKFAGNIGSLVNGETDKSQRFITLVRDYIPDLTPMKLVQEAYRFLGGRVDNSESPRSQDTQQHIARSRRAAASVPGSGAQSAINGAAKKLPRREALAAAIAELNSE